ncbi:MAG: polysaccharide biosynthesis protein, partial [Janthinobacterium sp.]
MKNKFLKLPRLHKQMIAAGADLVCLPLMFYFALFLHFDSLSMALVIEYKWPALAAAVTAVPIFLKLGLYRAVVRYIDQKIISTVVLGSTLSVLMLAVIVHVMQPGHLTLPPFLIYWVNSIVYVLASRYTARGYFVGLRERSSKTRVAIYGAGKAGSMLANALKPSGEYLPVIFIDDSVQRQNTTIHGIKVYPAKQIEQLAKSMHISTVLLALPSISRREQRQILDRLSTLQLKIKVTPSIASLVKGIARVEDV